jgi:PAS domain S-box-containing protein
MSDKKKTMEALPEEKSPARRRRTERDTQVKGPGRGFGDSEGGEEKFRLIFNKSMDALLLIDVKNGEILDANASTRAVFGYEANTLMGQHFSVLFPPESQQQTAETSKLAEAYGSALTQAFVRADGKVRMMDVTATLIPWGPDQRILAAFRDVTARKEAETRLEETFTQLEKAHSDLLSVMNLLNLGIIVLDKEGLISFINQTAGQLGGKKQRAVLGKHWSEWLSLRPEHHKRLSGMIGGSGRRRKKLQTQVAFDKRRRYWMEIEVREDPRAPERKILVLYDMTEVYDLRRLLGKKARFHDIVGKSEPMQNIFERINEVSTVDWIVLIEGETGTGKELVARAIHSSSHRKDKPFVALNCAGLTDSLLSSQLFGHKRGAFTGAVEDHRGVFEVAAGGTLFLDEIGDISTTMQNSLLRVLEEKQITRLGETRPRKVDVRILAATNRNLNDEVEKGTFRRDLLYRLRVARISLPLLRERREDIPLLCQTFLSQSCAATGKSVQGISDEAMRMLLQYAWPGNVRELKSAIDFATLHCKGPVIKEADFPPELRYSESSPLDAADQPQDERQRVLTALTQANGNRARAARLLGMSRATLYRRMASLDIQPTK